MQVSKLLDIFHVFEGLIMSMFRVFRCLPWLGFTFSFSLLPACQTQPADGSESSSSNDDDDDSDDDDDGSQGDSAHSSADDDDDDDDDDDSDSQVESESSSSSDSQEEDDDDDSDDDDSSSEDDASSESEDSEDPSSDDDASETADETSSSDESTETDDPSDPIVLYKENCAECHGENGEGVADKGYELQHPTRDYFDWVTRNGREGLGFPEEMPSYDETIITKEELDAIWDYLDAPPRPTTGEGFYLDYCASCHGEDGKGGVVGVSGNHSEPGFSFHVREGFTTADFGDRKGYMPAYDTSWLSDAELAEMKAYLDSIGAF
jgi:mono/diheme cytochrome c family protein